MNNLNKHPNSRYITAWACGKEIQRWSDSHETWADVDPYPAAMPSFGVNTEFRMKPHAELRRDYRNANSKSHPTVKAQIYDRQKSSWVDVVGEPTWDPSSTYRLIPVVSRWTTLRRDFEDSKKKGKPFELEVWAQKLNRWVDSPNPRWGENYEYRKKPCGSGPCKPYDYEKHKELYDALTEGKTLERRLNYPSAKTQWETVEAVSTSAQPYPVVFNTFAYEYRIKSEDPFRELKAAQDAGKKIEYQLSDGEWVLPIGEWSWVGQPEHYRIADENRWAKEVYNAGGLIANRLKGPTTEWAIGFPVWAEGYEYRPAYEVREELPAYAKERLAAVEEEVVDRFGEELRKERQLTGTNKLNEDNPLAPLMTPFGCKKVNGKYREEDLDYVCDRVIQIALSSLRRELKKKGLVL